MNIKKVNVNKGIAFIGDQHGDITNFIKLINYIELQDNPSVYFQVGDFGLMGQGFEKYLTKLNKYFQELDKKLYFIDGNHENHLWLRNQIKSSPTELVKLRSNIIYVPRGTYLELLGIKLYCIGGAFSTDREYRIVNKSYWEEEILTPEEINNLTIHQADLFITHDSPGDFNGLFKKDYFSNYSDYLRAGEYRDNLQKIFNETKAKINIHGHNHKYFYDEILENNRKVKQIEICLSSNMDPNLTQQYIIISKEILEQFKKFNYENIYDYFLSRKGE